MLQEQLIVDDFEEDGKKPVNARSGGGGRGFQWDTKRREMDVI